MTGVRSSVRGGPGVVLMEKNQIHAAVHDSVVFEGRGRNGGLSEAPSPLAGFGLQSDPITGPREVVLIKS